LAQAQGYNGEDYLFEADRFVPVQLSGLAPEGFGLLVAQEVHTS
jgi:hypothetical protein